MLKTCFGCCPLRNGVSTIAIANMIWNIMELIVCVEMRLHQYNKFTTVEYNNKRNETDNDSETEELYHYSRNERIPVITDIFMDYMFIVSAGWIVLEIISNINLKQSTFKQAPHKIYVWLTVYSANLLYMIIYSAHYTSLLIKHSISMNELKKNEQLGGGYLYLNLIYMVVILFEITVIYSYYIIEHNKMLNTYVQLKWKYISKGKVESQGVDITSTSAFMSSTSRQTQEGSKLPPYITSVIQD